MNKKSTRTYLVFAFLSLLVACSGPENTVEQTAPKVTEPSEVSQQKSADKQLYTLMDERVSQLLEFWPEYASYLGMGSDVQNARWEDISFEGYARQHHSAQETIAAIRALDRAALSEQAKVDYDLFLFQEEIEAAAEEFDSNLIPLGQWGGVHTLNDTTNFVPLNTVKDYENWLSRMAKIPEQVDNTMVLMKKGIETGMMPSFDTMARIPAQIERQITGSGQQSLFYTVFESMGDKIADDDKARLQASAQDVIEKQIIPAYKEFKAFFEEEYLPACRKTHGIWDTPNGKAHYEYLAWYHTTTKLTPDEIHQIGLDEVARNRAEMDKVIEEVGFEGTFDEFVTFLRTDSQFYYDSPEALYEGYLAVSKRLDPELVKLFGKLPRIPYGLKPIPDEVAPDTTTAYYTPPAADGSRAGYYYVNLYQPETRPKYEMEVLSVHEAVPGHHLQLALSMEMGELHAYRRYFMFVTAFVEGWGLYSERLGYDMGLYTDPYSRFGQLTYDMWRSVRLVVDTGIHHKGWTRQQAIDYFKANAAKSEQDIINEIDRYISYPGQALAYKIGQLKILELRKQAEENLGDRFDIRGFHDTVLGAGSIPLNVLEANVNEWVRMQQE